MAFHLYRPILRSFRVSREADASWPMLNSSTALLGSAEGDDPGLYLEPNGPPAVK